MIEKWDGSIFQHFIPPPFACNEQPTFEQPRSGFVSYQMTNLLANKTVERAQ